MIHTNPIAHSMSEEEDFSPKQKYELYSFELISCPAHPGFGVEIFCAKENFQPALLCIKCILDPHTSKETRGASMIAIRDVITKSVEKTNLVAAVQSNLLVSETLEQQYLEFEKKDYIRLLERHVDHQMKKLDRDIEKVKESLQKLREQFVQFFGKQIQTLVRKDEEIKKHMTNYVQEKDELNKVSFPTVGELLKELNTLKNYKDYEKFVKLLYKRSTNPKEGGEDLLQKMIFELMDRMKSKALSMKSTIVDTHILEELREKIEAINILDDTPSLEIPSLEPKLDKLLDKLKKANKKGSSPLVESLTPKRSQIKINADSNKSSPFDLKNTQKLSLLELLKQKLGVDKSEQPKTENPSSSEKKYKDSMLGISNILKDFGTKGSTNMMTEETPRDNRRSSNSWIDSKVLHQPSRQEMAAESENSDNRGPHHHTPELQSARHGQSRLSRDLLATSEKQTAENSNQDAADSSPRYRLSYSSESKRQREKSPADGNPEGKSETEHLTQRKKSHANFEIEDDNPADQDERRNAAANGEYKSALPSEGSIEYVISQLVDEKLNGFAVYQNSVRDEHSNFTEEVFNKLSSQEWFKMARLIRDEYTEIAIAARPGIKEELKLHNTTDLSELRELVNEKIKRVKKQT